MTVQIVFVIALLIGSALFSASEMALSSANRMRLAAAAEEGSRAAAWAVDLLDRYEDTLSTILIGNNLCNIGADSLVTALAMSLLGARYNALSSLIVTVCVTLVVLLFCESAPKIIAKKNANRLATGLSGFLQALGLLLSPLIFLLRHLVRLITAPFPGEQAADPEAEAAAELQSIIETVEDEGVIDSDRSELLLSALDFSQGSVMDVMTARVDVDALSVHDDWRELLLNRPEPPFSRVPVYDDGIDDIVGVLYLNRFFRALLDDPGADIRDYLMEPLYLYKTTKLPDALSRFRRSQQHLAIVTDEYGGMLGVVTLEDVLEQIVGDIWDETDEVEDEIVTLPDGAWEVDGDLPIADFAELAGVPEDSLTTDSATAGGWTIEKFGAFPRPGDTFVADGLTVKVLAMDEDGLRVERILVRREAAAGS
ncbi:MAG: HlyC/CorC family transporter [Oscillospiraceae bacterium]|nr:HlyC/CorC family transporter [Oscillospiraceae bacterium]